MPNIGDPITEPIPPVGTAGTTYATQLVAFLTEVKSRLEADVPLSSLLIGTLDMSNNAFTNVASVGLYESASQPSTPVGSIQRYQNNLWYVSASGAFALTNGASLNATGIDGITGDYGSPNPAELRFVDADATYYFYDNFSTTAWAATRQRYVEIAGGATSTQRVRIQWTAGSSWTISLPSAAPGAQALLQMDSSGNVTASSTFVGTITATNYLRTQEIERRLAAAYYAQLAGGAGTFTGTEHGLPAGGVYVYMPLPVQNGEQIKSWSLNFNKASNASFTVSAELVKITDSTGAATTVGAIQSNSANAPGNIVLSQTGLSETVAGTSYAIRVASTHGTPDTDKARGGMVGLTVVS